MAILNLASIRECTVSEGPGKRFAIWAQGCLKRCEGCCNAKMQPLEKKSLVGVTALNQKILDAKKKHAIEGISLIGGEPFLQAKSFATVARFAKKNDLSVLIFTGYLLEELKSIPMEGGLELLDEADLLVDGPFLKEFLDFKRPWVGSVNQRVHFLSDVYEKGIEYQGERQMEILISNQEIFINGWPYEGV